MSGTDFRAFLDAGDRVFAAGSEADFPLCGIRRRMCLGNSDYVLLGKTAGQSESVGLILTLFFLGTAVFAFFLIRSRRLWTLLFFTVPCVLNVIFQVRMGIAGTAVLAAALSGSGGLYEIRRRILDESNPGRRARRPLRPGHSASGDF